MYEEEKEYVFENAIILTEGEFEFCLEKLLSEVLVRKFTARFSTPPSVYMEMVGTPAH